MRRIIKLLLITFLIIIIVGCQNSRSEVKSDEKETIMLAAAASLENVFKNELIPLFEKENKNIQIKSTYDSSGKLQTQIEQGADIDIFISASMKQMDYLKNKKLMKNESTIKLLENKIVLIVPKDNSNDDIKEFKDILKAETIAIGDPRSVPAGQYAKESLENLSIWNEVEKKSSIGTNVTEVLNWVAEGSADAGIVYQTDAKSNKNVEIIKEAPEKSVKKVIYPVGIVDSTKNEESTKLFMEFLQSEKAIDIFKEHGFTPNI